MNAGKQLKTIAVIVGIVIVIAGLVLTYNLSKDSYYDSWRGWQETVNGGIFFLGLVVSCVVGYLSTISLYAFGVLVDNSTKAVDILEKLEATKNGAKPKVAVNFVEGSPEHASEFEAPENREA